MDHHSVCFYICNLNLEIVEKFQARKRATHPFPPWCSQPKNSALNAPGNFQKFRSEFLVKWKVPIECIYDIPD